jgi:hypothetical protein
MSLFLRRLLLAFGTGCAETVYLKGMTRREITKLLSDSPLYFIDLWGRKLNRFSTLGADQVVMAAPVELRLIAADAVVQLHFRRYATLRKKLQGAVDGSETDPRIRFPDLLMQFVDGQVIPGLQEDLENPAPLSRLLQAQFRKVATEDLLRRQSGFSRCALKIVHSLFWHRRAVPSRRVYNLGKFAATGWNSERWPPEGGCQLQHGRNPPATDSALLRLTLGRGLNTIFLVLV